MSLTRVLTSFVCGLDEVIRRILLNTLG
jgi:hypothetical protein